MPRRTTFRRAPVGIASSLLETTAKVRVHPLNHDDFRVSVLPESDTPPRFPGSTRVGRGHWLQMKDAAEQYGWLLRDPVRLLHSRRVACAPSRVSDGTKM